MEGQEHNKNRMTLFNKPHIREHTAVSFDVANMGSTSSYFRNLVYCARKEPQKSNIISRALGFILRG